MAVTPIRRQMSVVPATQMPAPAPMSAPMPSQQGWFWNGTQWCWGPDWDDPCCPPSSQPPASGWNWCWCPPQGPSVPPAPLPPPPLSGPIIGVTDGSDAAPGQVGEFVSFSASVSYTAAVSTTTQIVSLGVLQPGDWDVNGAMEFTTPIGAAVYRLSPVPTGMSGDLVGGMSVSGAMTNEWPALVSIPARGSFSVPTLLAFSVNIYQTYAGLPAGTAILLASARRRR